MTIFNFNSKFKLYILIFFLLPISVFAQEKDDLFTRLKAIHNGSVTYYNTDGIDFTSQTFTNSFTEKDLKYVYRKYSIGNEDVKVKDNTLPYNNFNVVKSKKITDSLNETSSYYFIEDKQKMVTVICFSYFEKPTKQFEQKFIDLIIEDKIPMNIFEDKRIDSIDFAGRKIQLSNSCYWTNVNTVQCPYYGEMNWSVHKTITSAKKAVQNQLSLTKTKKGLKAISEEEVDVLFENMPVKAIKVVYGFTGLTNLAVKTSGGKTLTAYYVASEVRNNYMSCVMSFWNNDQINDSGLPPLLEKVMQLRK
ncbi:MAG: hypothetical protein EOO86_13085 [Pedobacter sp.]|nr:MAG: hypothetical protein EOO86_13085 [Pedobacter sp.]